MDATRRRVYLSRIFQWYAVDFGARRLAIGDKRGLLSFVVPYLGPDDAKLLLANNHWAVSFMRYDWTLNGLWSGEVA